MEMESISRIGRLEMQYWNFAIFYFIKKLDVQYNALLAYSMTLQMQNRPISCFMRKINDYTSITN